MPQAKVNNILALDVGEKRVGVARVNSIARIPEALPALANDQFFALRLRQVIDEHDIDLLIVGLPRSLQGTETAQSDFVRSFCAAYLEDIGVPLQFQDETLSSVVAKQRVGDVSRVSGIIDSTAAALLLEDYLQETA